MNTETKKRILYQLQKAATALSNALENDNFGTELVTERNKKLNRMRYDLYKAEEEVNKEKINGEDK